VLSQTAHVEDAAGMVAHRHAARRSLMIGLTAFLTVVDLFATQAILPSLA
jgi:MFS transporter, YNFM family, putative membrane transport protein